MRNLLGHFKGEGLVLLRLVLLPKMESLAQSYGHPRPGERLPVDEVWSRNANKHYLMFRDFGPFEIGLNQIFFGESEGSIKLYSALVSAW